MLARDLVLTKLPPDLQPILALGSEGNKLAFMSGSVCYELTGGLVVMAGGSTCINWDSHGIAFSSSGKLGIEKGAGVLHAVVLRLNTDGAPEVNSGLSFSNEVGHTFRHGGGLGAKATSEYSFTSGDVSGSVQIEAGWGEGASLGGFHVNAGNNTGYVWEWCADFGLC